MARRGPLVKEWRRLREGHPNDGRSLSWLVTEERILNLELAMAEEHGLTLAARDPAARGGVEERAATLDRSGPGRHPVGADKEGAAQVGAAVLHRGTVVEVGAASSPRHVCCMSASDVGGKAPKVLPKGRWGVILRLLSVFPVFLCLRNLGVLSLSPGCTRGIEPCSPNGRPRGMFHKGRSASCVSTFSIRRLECPMPSDRPPMPAA